MRIFSYRNKQHLKRLLIVLGVLAVLLVIACVSYVIYLGRHMVYTPDGAHLSLPGSSEVQKPSASRPVDTPDGSELIVGDPIKRPEATPSLTPDGEPAPEADTFTEGYYADSASLMNASDVHNTLNELLSEREDDAPPLAVMLDVKSEFGNFYYSTELTEAPIASVDTSAVDALIAALAARDDIHLIARLPAFRDTAYALSHTDRGLPLSSGALWVDSSGCYWLDPGSDSVLTRLRYICEELQALGFDEVMFENFSFPDSESIVYDEDRSRTVELAALTLAEEVRLPISFCFTEDDLQFASVARGTHLCLKAEDGSDIIPLLEAVSDALTGDEGQVIFLTESRDTRFDEHIRLRPVLDN